MKSLVKGLRYRALRRVKELLDVVEAERDDEAWAKMHEGELRSVAEESVSVVHEPEPVGSTERRYVEQFTSETELQRYKRRSEEYLRVIESVQAERDDWMKRFQTHVREHLTAQSMYERDLVRSRQAGAVLLRMFNEYRKEKGDDPVELQRMSDILPEDGAPVGQFEAQVKKHVELLRSLEPPFDALLARDSVD